MAAPQPVADNYTQPVLPRTKSGWLMNGLDYQIVTKSDGWNQDQTKRLNEYEAGKSLCGINYAAIAVPYNSLSKYTNYVNDARTKGLKVWHRSHWNEWEGDNGASATMTCQQYLDSTYDFIVANPTLFANNDIFTTCVECNNAENNGNTCFRSGGSFSYSIYNQFLKDQVRYANAAFTVINKSVQTNLLSVSLSTVNLAGQALDSGDTGSGSGLGNNDFVTYFDSLLTIDHYLSDSYRYSDATKYWDRYSSDLDKIHAAFPSCDIAIGEWGYHTNTSIPESERAGMYREIIRVIRSKSYIKYVCFWNHMGQSSSSIFSDSSGSIVTDGITPKEIKQGFTSGNRSCGTRIRV